MDPSISLNPNMGCFHIRGLFLGVLKTRIIVFFWVYFVFPLFVEAPISGIPHTALVFNPSIPWRVKKDAPMNYQAPL